MSSQKNLLHSKDGIEYEIDDCVKIACDDCKGCQKCCENMADTIVLDPYDVWQLTHKLKISGGGTVSFEVLISEDGPLELTPKNGLILPNMKMVETKKEGVGACSFLNNGRCSIHFCRPGICRLYPLGRIFSEDSLKPTYFILDEELGCPIKDTTEISVKEWIGIPDERYGAFQAKWNELKKRLQNAILSGEFSSEALRRIQIKLLELFFVKPYGDDFFKEFDERLNTWMNGV